MVVYVLCFVLEIELSFWYGVMMVKVACGFVCMVDFDVDFAYVVGFLYDFGRLCCLKFVAEFVPNVELSLLCDVVCMFYGEVGVRFRVYG